jgi:hypothetical protein
MSVENNIDANRSARIGLLEIFQDFINPSEKDEIGVTLNVHGTVVSGIMISMKRYYEDIGSTFIEKANIHSTPDGGAAAKKTLKAMFDEIKQPPSDEELAKGQRFNHIFLRDVRIYTDYGIIRGDYWVGRIDSVDGFLLGNAQPKQE